MNVILLIPLLQVELPHLRSSVLGECREFDKLILRLTGTDVYALEFHLMDKNEANVPPPEANVKPLDYKETFRVCFET